MREVFLPRTLDELWDLLLRRPEAVIYAGGTDVLVKLRAGLIAASGLICLERIEELKAVQDQGDEVYIGAATTHRTLLADPVIQEHFPVLIRALNVLGSPPVRNMGTIGGNLVTASPAGDTLPPLYVLDAEVEVRWGGGAKRLPLSQFILGPGRTSLGPGQLLTGVRLKKSADYNVHHFEKVGQRKALAIAVVSLAAVLKVSDSGLIEKARLAWGSVGPTVIRSAEVESALEGRMISRNTLTRAAALAQTAVSPIDDIRASGAYRRTVAGNLLLRLTNYTR
ncbi:MAG: xanthine dehydrogenase family protein subunit M [Deltaproteobacteria bacterium]|nr:xanthine dehydrogenase family protein subunit M [Deltaproteobacteria bacterium]